MKHIVIGTAGHVDHGKTVLVKALTGVDTDRLKEEKKRGISIELGFARFKLPSGLATSIIDVPGHERFIKNMLAGVGGIDIVMLVVAADEGVMPQTREHLDIIQLLQVKKSVVVITKKDLVDEEWLDLVYDDLKETLRDTVLEGVEMVTVSAVTGENMDHLRRVLDKLAAEVEEKKATGLPRLPVDRVFSVVGFGTVATGTLLSGQIRPGDSLQVYPRDDIFRVRNLHVHGQKVEVVEAGQRVAVNLTGAEKADISRGSVLSAPGSLKPTHRLDVKLKYLSGASRALQHRTRVRVHLGTLETLGRVLLLDREKLEPGAEVYVQLQLEKTVAAARGDHFVLRSYSPMRTIGGGIIVDPAPVRHRRYRPEVLEALAMAEKGTPDQLVEQHLLATGRALTIKTLSRDTGLDDDVIRSALDHLLNAGSAVQLSGDGDDYYLAGGTMQVLESKLLATLDDYHSKYPLREGCPREEIRSRFFDHLEGKPFQMLINYWEQSGKIVTRGSYVARRDFAPSPTPALQEKIKVLEQIFIASGCQPPPWQDAASQAGIGDDESAQELLNYLLGQGTLVKLTSGIYMHREVVQKAVELVRLHLQEKGEMTLGDVRDLLETSRKYILPLLEYLDQEKITRRVGDLRVPGKRF